MNKDIKWIIMETLDITPSEFEKRFELEDIDFKDMQIKEIAEKCYNLDKGQIVPWTTIKTFPDTFTNIPNRWSVFVDIPPNWIRFSNTCTNIPTTPYNINC